MARSYCYPPEQRRSRAHDIASYVPTVALANIALRKFLQFLTPLSGHHTPTALAASLGRNFYSFYSM